MQEIKSTVINFDGANNSTEFVDETGKIITNGGSPIISTTQSKFGGSSGYFNGASYIDVASSSDFSMVDAFTIDFWVYTDPNVIALARLCENQQYNATGGWHLSYNGSDSTGSRRLGFQLGLNGGGGSRIDSNSAIPTNQWVHIALTRYLNVIRMFVDGTLQTAIMITDEIFTSDKLRIGATLGSPTNYFQGYIDAFQIIKGRALYTENFTVPTEPPQYDFYYNNVALLLPFDGSNNSTVFNDYSLNKNIITPYGNAKISTTQSKFGGSSGYFDGSGDYLSIPSHTSLELGTNDFTIECYIYPQTYVGTPTIYSRQDSALALQFRINTSGYLQGIFRETSSTAVIALTSSNTISLNQWSHVALTRKNGIAYIFINGVYKGQIAVSYSLNSPTNEHGVIGAVQYGGSGINQPYMGYVDEFRLTNGIARYTTDFTPPTHRFYYLIASLEYGIYNDFIRCAPGEAIGSYLSNSLIFIDDINYDIINYGEINIQGYYTIDKTPVHRKILLCTYPNYFIIRETWSNPITGYYSFNNVKKQDYILIFEDYENLHHSKIRRLFMDQM